MPRQITSQNKAHTDPIYQGNTYLFDHRFYGKFKGIVTRRESNSMEMEVINSGDPIKRPNYPTIEKGGKMWVNMGLVQSYAKV